MDAMLRAINESETIRVIAALTTGAVREACSRQQLRGGGALALGRGLTAGALLATLAKGEGERVRVRFEGGGPLGELLVDAHGDGRVRACITGRAEDIEGALAPTGRPSVAALVGTRGHVVVTRDLGLANPYQGSVELDTGEVDEDIERYLQTSEQLPSSLRTAVILDQHGEVLRAAGILAQTFPGGDPAIIDEVRGRMAGEALRSLLSAHERELDELVGFALGGAGFRRMQETELRFSCPCGPERALSVLSTLGARELDLLADEQEQTEVRCNFCGSTTVVGADEVREVAARLRRVQS
jgi:molecular chaperone Hsp33